MLLKLLKSIVFFKYKFKNIEFTIDNGINKSKFTILTICNGKTYGRGDNIAPDAQLLDGYFVDKLYKLAIPFSLFCINL